MRKIKATASHAVSVLSILFILIALAVFTAVEVQSNDDLLLLPNKVSIEQFVETRVKNYFHENREQISLTISTSLDQQLGAGYMEGSQSGSAYGCNYIQLVPPEDQPKDNRCPADKPYLEVKVWSDFKGGATEESLCQNPSGDPVPCGTCELGFGDRSQGPGAVSECVAGP